LEDYKDNKMASYVYTGNLVSQQSAVIATDKIRISTTGTGIHAVTGYPRVAGTGTATAATNSVTVTGVGTAFNTQLEIGAWIGNTTGTTVGIVANIANATSLTLVANAGVALSNVAYTFNNAGVPYAIATQQSAIFSANDSYNSVYCGQGNVVAFLTTGANASAGTEFSITELGMPHAVTGTE
jgi:hypothetical protein